MAIIYMRNLSGNISLDGRLVNIFTQESNHSSTTKKGIKVVWHHNED